MFTGWELKGRLSAVQPIRMRIMDALIQTL